MIHLYDVSAMLYIGNSVDRPGDDFISEYLKGLPVRGLRYTLEKLITANQLASDDVYAIMDSHTNKNELYPEYKSQRTFDKEIFVQREMIRWLLPRLGITMISQDNFEADDLFYCFIVSKFIQSLKEPGAIPSDGIQIHCDDRDLLGCIMHPAISRIGLTSKTPAVFSNNYSDILAKSGYFVAYNSVLPHELFFGKASNNLKSIKCAEPKKAYLDFLKFGMDKYKPEMLSMEFVLNNWISFSREQGVYTEEFYTELEERKPVVYPRLNWEKDKAIIKGKLDKHIATDYLSLLREKSLLRMLGLQAKNPEQVNTNLIDKWVSIYRSGVVHVDNFITADSTFFFSDESSGSGNIGGF